MQLSYAWAVPIERYRLGCPAWAIRQWCGSLFRPQADSGDYLAEYASVFTAVEGNTTFYALPKAETVARWRSQTPAEFRFCFKFPSEITHDRRLRDASAATQRFLALLEPLQDRLGPLLLQLPPSYAAVDLSLLEQYLRALPDGFVYAVELRHPSFFDDGPTERSVLALLRELGVDWVNLDTRGLYDADPTDRYVAATLRSKPRLPVRGRSTASSPIVRFIPHPEFARNRPWLDAWVTRLGQWLERGLSPYVFMHAPNVRWAPHLARRFHDLLRQAIGDVGTMPPWPGESAPNRQLGLFDDS